MKRIAYVFLCLPFVFSASVFDVGYNIGDEVTDFKLKNVDGNYVSMASKPENNGYIIVFTCNTCPWAKGYEQRIVDLHNKYVSKGYPVIAIQPNDPSISAGDSYDEMQRRANEHEYPFPYVLDKTQDIAVAYGATKTPDVFVVQKVKKNYVLRYKGTIDDSPRDGSKANEKYVENAVDQLLAGRAVKTTSTKGMGCSIKWSAASKDKMGKS